MKPTFFTSKLFRRCLIAQFVLAVIIFTYAALMPSDQVTVNQSDTVLHVVGNFLLLTSAWLAFQTRISLHSLFALILPYSLFVEYAQVFTASRSYDVQDLLANAGGLIIALAFCYLLELFYKYYTRSKIIQN